MIGIYSYEKHYDKKEMDICSSSIYSGKFYYLED
jgi:hypothetical protein